MQITLDDKATKFCRVANTLDVELTAMPAANKLLTTSRWPSIEDKCSALRPVSYKWQLALFVAWRCLQSQWKYLFCPTSGILSVSGNGWKIATRIVCKTYFQFPFVYIIIFVVLTGFGQINNVLFLTFNTSYYAAKNTGIELVW